MKKIVYITLLFAFSNLLIAQRAKTVNKALKTSNPEAYKEKMEQLSTGKPTIATNIKKVDSMISASPSSEVVQKIVAQEKNTDNFNFFDSTASKKDNSIKSKSASKSKKDKSNKVKDSKKTTEEAVVSKTENTPAVKVTDSSISKTKDTSIKFEIPDAKMPINTAVSNGVPMVEYVDAAAPRELKYKADEKDVDHFKDLRVKFEQDSAVAAAKAKDSLAKVQAQNLKEFNARHTTPQQQTEFEQFRYGDKTNTPPKKRRKPTRKL